MSSLDDHKPTASEVVIGRDGPVPLYQRIADIIASYIANGQFGPGEPIPSEEDLRRRFGISQMTARRVTRELREQGLIHTVPGEGSYAGPPGTPKAAHLIPRYQQIAGQIAADIRSGKIPDNRPIPSEGDLVTEHNVSKATIRQAITYLRHQGWVITVPYWGTYPASPRDWPTE